MSREEQSNKIHDALHYLDDEMIEDVEKLRGFVETEESEQEAASDRGVVRNGQRKSGLSHKSWKKWTALAASICLLVVGSRIYEVYIQQADDTPNIPEVSQEMITENKAHDTITDEKEVFRQEDDISDQSSRPESAIEESLKEELQETVSADSLKKGVTIPKMKVSLKNTDGVEADMLGFFILNGRSYIQYEFQWDYKEKGADFVGDYAGHITGMIDEWTELDGYVDGAGTYTGNVYEVKGVSPDFMLCMVWEDGAVETFINHNNITLCKGSDLVDNRLDLRGNYDAIAFEKVVDSKFSYEPLELTEEEMDVFDQFLTAFAEGDYVYVEEKVQHPFGGDLDTPDMLEFYFLKENGVRLRFRTLGDGYVSFPWIRACVKIDQNIYDEVVDILRKQLK